MELILIMIIIIIIIIFNILVAILISKMARYETSTTQINKTKVGKHTPHQKRTQHTTHTRARARSHTNTNNSTKNRMLHLQQIQHIN